MRHITGGNGRTRFSRVAAVLAAAEEADVPRTRMKTDFLGHVQDVDFRTTELREHRDRARTLAVDAARELLDEAP